MRVVIVGAGLGGLCLAQGLRGVGIEFAVFEREPRVGTHRQGYRINLNATGSAALRTCLPDRLFRLHVAVSHRQRSPQVTVRGADGGRVLISRPGEQQASAVDRSTLRRVLLAGLGENIHFGVAVTGADEHGELARVRLTDGTSVDADLVVGADGPRSTVCRALAPGAWPHPVGVRGIYGRVRLREPSNLGSLGREAMRSRFTGLVDESGTMLALGGWQPGRDAVEAGRRADVDLSGAEPYLMWALLTRHAVPRHASAAELHRHVREQLRGFTAQARELVAAARVPDTFALTVRSHAAVPVWPSGRVTLLGDAAHTMSPAGGEGANTALADAAALVEAMRGAAGRDIPSAVAGYENALRLRGNEAIARSANYGSTRNESAGNESAGTDTEVPA